MRKIVHLSIVASSLFLLTACGGSSGGESGNADKPGGDGNKPIAKKITVSGKVVDGPIKGATVCLDMNKNSKCDANEPSATTDSNGYYSFKIDEKDASSGNIISIGGIDTITNEEIRAILKTKLEFFTNKEKVNISPATTLVDILVESGMAKDEAKKKVQELLDLKNVKDVTSVDTEEIRKILSALHKALTEEKNNYESFIEKIRQDAKKAFEDLKKELKGGNQSTEPTPVPTPTPTPTPTPIAGFVKADLIGKTFSMHKEDGSIFMGLSSLKFLQDGKINGKMPYEIKDGILILHGMKFQKLKEENGKIYFKDQSTGDKYYFEKVNTNIPPVTDKPTYEVNADVTTQTDPNKVYIVYDKGGNASGYQFYVFKEFGNIDKDSLEVEVLEGEDKYNVTKNETAVTVLPKGDKYVNGIVKIKVKGKYGKAKKEFSVVYTVNIKGTGGTTVVPNSDIDFDLVTNDIEVPFGFPNDQGIEINSYGYVGQGQFHSGSKMINPFTSLEDGKAGELEVSIKSTTPSAKDGFYVLEKVKVGDKSQWKIKKSNTWMEVNEDIIVTFHVKSGTKEGDFKVKFKKNPNYVDPNATDEFELVTTAIEVPMDQFVDKIGIKIANGAQASLIGTFVDTTDVIYPFSEIINAHEKGFNPKDLNITLVDDVYEVVQEDSPFSSDIKLTYIKVKDGQTKTAKDLTINVKSLTGSTEGQFVVHITGGNTVPASTIELKTTPYVINRNDVQDDKLYIVKGVEEAGKSVNPFKTIENDADLSKFTFKLKDRDDDAIKNISSGNPYLKIPTLEYLSDGNNTYILQISDKENAEGSECQEFTIIIQKPVTPISITMEQAYTLPDAQEYAANGIEVSLAQDALNFEKTGAGTVVWNIESATAGGEDAMAVFKEVVPPFLYSPSAVIEIKLNDGMQLKPSTRYILELKATLGSKEATTTLTFDTKAAPVTADSTLSLVDKIVTADQDNYKKGDAISEDLDNIPVFFINHAQLGQTNKQYRFKLSSEDNNPTYDIVEYCYDSVNYKYSSCIVLKPGVTQAVPADLKVLIGKPGASYSDPYIYPADDQYMNVRIQNEALEVVDNSNLSTLGIELNTQDSFKVADFNIESSYFKKLIVKKEAGTSENQYIYLAKTLPAGAVIESYSIDTDDTFSNDNYKVDGEEVKPKGSNVELGTLKLKVIGYAQGKKFEGIYSTEIVANPVLPAFLDTDVTQTLAEALSGATGVQIDSVASLSKSQLAPSYGYVDIFFKQENSTAVDKAYVFKAFGDVKKDSITVKVLGDNTKYSFGDYSSNWSVRIKKKDAAQSGEVKVVISGTYGTSNTPFKGIYILTIVD